MKKGWETKRLGDVAETQYGLSEAMNEDGKGYRIFRMGEVQDGSHDGRAVYHLCKGSREALQLPWYVPDRSPDFGEPRLDAYDILTGDIGAGYPPLPAGHDPFFAWQR